MLYRVLVNLEVGKRGILPAGEITRLEWLSEENRRVLLDGAAVSELQAPPLGVLPGWKARAKKLAGTVGTAAEFLELEDSRAAEILHVSTALIAAYKEHVRSYLVVPPATG